MRGLKLKDVLYDYMGVVELAAHNVCYANGGSDPTRPEGLPLRKPQRVKWVAK